MEKPNWNDEKALELWVNRMLDLLFDVRTRVVTEDVSDFIDVIEANAPLVAARERGDLSLLIERLERGIATPWEQAHAATLLRPKKRGRPTQSLEERRQGEMVVGDGAGNKSRFDKTLVAMATTDAFQIQALFREHYKKRSRIRAMEFAARRCSHSDHDAHDLIAAIEVEMNRPASRSIVFRR
ncbi:hypothetical protein [Rhizobium sp.]